LENEKFPWGIFYMNPSKTTFEQNTGIYKHDQRPLYERGPDFEKLSELIDKFKITGQKS
jgi:hypothetical protein